VITPREFYKMSIEPQEIERLIDKALERGELTVCLGQYKRSDAIYAVMQKYIDAGWHCELERHQNNTLRFARPRAPGMDQ